MNWRSSTAAGSSGLNDISRRYNRFGIVAQLESDVTDSMRAFVNLFGYDSKTGMLDHFGLQLAVMGHALQLPPTPATREATDAYFDRHLLWAQRLLHAACGRDDSAFYQSLAQITQRFLDSEAEEQRGRAT